MAWLLVSQLLIWRSKVWTQSVIFPGCGQCFEFHSVPWHCWWPDGVMVRALACDSRGCEFNSQPFRCQVMTLVKLFAHMCLCHQAVYFGTVTWQWCPATGKVTVGLVSCQTYWPCVTDLSGLSTYGLKACVMEMSTPPTLLMGYGTLYLYLTLTLLFVWRVSSL